MWDVVFMGTPDFSVGSLKALLEAGQYRIQIRGYRTPDLVNARPFDARFVRPSAARIAHFGLGNTAILTGKHPGIIGIVASDSCKQLRNIFCDRDESVFVAFWLSDHDLAMIAVIMSVFRIIHMDKVFIHTLPLQRHNLADTHAGQRC